MLEVGGDLLSGLLAAGHGADDERSAVGGITTDKDVRGILGVLGLQEAHG